MKSALKLAAAVAALTVVISSFSACNLFDSDKEQPSTTEAPFTGYYEESTTRKENAEEPSTEEPATEEATSEKKVEVESIETILNNIKDYPIGTAGSTGKSVELAIRLINYTENCDADEAKSDIKKFKNNLSDMDKEIFAQCFDEIDYMARKLLSGSTDTIRQYIDETSEKYDKGNYSTEKYEKIFDIISAE
ncbi:MAG: hypothetical protein MJ168_09620 [Clostridia bacterium]|nr:hypothetical protein [Clostridia bacterium]